MLQQDVSDGARVARGQQIAVLSGDARMILMIERTCLNFLCRLSGISTLTAEYVRRVAGTRAGIFDTRKTTPGWRRIEKYAVTCGGGNNHRMGLYDAIMIKDNHLAMYGNYVRDHRCSPTKAVALARQWVHENQFLLPNGLNTIVQIEVESLSQLRIVLEEPGNNSCQTQHTIDTPSSSNQHEKSRAAPDIVLLDNMDTEQLRQAVEIRDELNPAVQLEASGGVTLETVESIAQTGVERISVGAITHSARNLDIALDWRLETT
jgi:nicotinate-nucleotide pyrophosphorylase (carboxylating)